ncbi:MAG: DUF3365 domain-containing protein [Deltaproteobacteria bacterium]|nr:DUF3365 domain-containing protein [Deltaproteobacteria bacterium]
MWNGSCARSPVGPSEKTRTRGPGFDESREVLMTAPERDMARSRDIMFLLGALAWVLTLAISLAWNLVQTDRSMIAFARSNARAAFAKDLVYRRWASMHGGLYVQPSEATPPNPYLSHIPDRDLTATDGRRLTLINPAYMTRQVHELGDAKLGLLGHITSLDPIRPENGPDEWEAKALRSLADGAWEVTKVADLNGEPHFRFMRALMTEESCLKCHGVQGYKVGEIRGGISVSVPLESYMADVAFQYRLLVSAHVLIGLLGLAGLWMAWRLDRRSTKALQESEAMYRDVLSSISDAVFLTDLQGRLTFVCPNVQTIFGLSREEASGRGSIVSILGSMVFGPGQLRDEGDELVNQEQTITRPDGRERHLLVNVKRIAIQGSEVLYTCRDVTERRLAQSEARERARTIRIFYDLVNSSNNIVVAKDTGLRYLLVNAAYTDLTGWTNEQVIGRTDEELFEGKATPEQIAGFMANDRAALALPPGEILTSEEGITESDGQVRTFWTRKFPIFMDGVLLGTGTMTTEITELKRVQAELEQARDAAEESSRIKTEFLANMSHELRTPLNGILGMMQLLRTTDVDEEKQGYVGMAERSAQRLSELLSDILDLVKIEAGRMPLKPKAFRPEEILQAVSDAFGMTCHQKGLELVLHRVDEFPGSMLGDKARILQVVFNLVGNACKYTDEGKVEVEISGFKCFDEVPFRLMVRVRDTGIGIPDEIQNGLFEPFVQADGSMTRKYQGAGLGLALVKRLVILMGGHLALESREGHGTTVYVTIPVEVGTSYLKTSA